jgi:peptide/nickel transport system permease protein
MTAIEIPAAEPIPPFQGAVASIGRTAAAVWKFARRRPLGAFGGFLVILFLFTALFADGFRIGPLEIPRLAPYDANARGVGPPLVAPNSTFILGTDANGRDVFSRVLVGSQISLSIGFAVIVINVFFSTLLGLLAGYFQGPIDYLIQRSGEVWSAFPGLIALLLIVSILGPPHTSGGSLLTIMWDMRNLVFAFSLGAVFGGSRVVRGVTLQLKQAEYVTAARALGATGFRIIVRHIMPNVLPYVIVGATAGLGVIILGEAALSFLGLGVAPGTPSWGQDLSGRNRVFAIQGAWWVAVAPGAAISITVLGFNLFGDALRDILDPRLRGSGSGRGS